MMGIKINKIAYYLPSEKLDSNGLKTFFSDFNAVKAENITGIKSRRISAENENSIELAYMASLNVFKNFDKRKIDFIVFCTQTPNYILPTGACILQNKLEISKQVGAFDFNLGCSGYIYGLSICKGLIDAKIAKNILFLTADTLTKYVHKEDKGNRTIFGDAGTATIISYDPDSDSKIGKFELGTDGSGFNNLIIKNGRGKNHSNRIEQFDDYTNKDSFIYMNGPEIFNFTIKNIPYLVEETLKKNKLNKEDIDYYIFHQANKFILEYLMKKIKIDQEKFHIDMEETGNTSSSTIPIALHKALSANKIKKGDKVLLAGFGVGLSWGATIIEI